MCSPLYFAAYGGHVAVAKALIAKGADVDQAVTDLKVNAGTFKMLAEKRTAELAGRYKQVRTTILWSY